METNTADFRDQFKQLNLEGWLEDWDIRNIYEEVSKLQSGQQYLEIGVAHGKSAAIACLAAKEGVQVRGIDRLNWHETREKNISEFLKMNGKADYNWQFMFGDSQQIADGWEYGPIDLLFIDGDHTYEGCLRDIFSWAPKVKSGGKILFDDYNDLTGVKKAVDDFFLDHRLWKDKRIDGEMFIATKL